MKPLDLIAASAAACLLATSSASALDAVAVTEKGEIAITTIADGLRHPWGLAFLPDGGMLVTERSGALRHVDEDGVVSDPVAGVPDVVASGQGGLLDVALDPDFAGNRIVYVTFAEAGDGGSGTAVARGVLSGDMTALDDVEVIFRQQPKVQSRGHFGSRLAFDGDGHLFVTMGDRQSARFRDQAQQLDSHIGKIVRINPDGTVPDDNPFAGTEGALPEIWALGVRNVQAAAIHPESGLLWEIEHGPRGGDELNVIEPGANYGWPEVTLGVDYDGSTIGEGIESAEGMVDAIYSWTPVIAPSGMMFYDGDAFPQWQGNLFVGGLASTALVRLELDGDSVAHEERLLEDLGMRIRDVAQGPAGAVYVITDAENGAILRLGPRPAPRTDASGA